MIIKIVYVVFFIAFNGFFVEAQEDSTDGKIYKFRDNLAYYTNVTIDVDEVESHYLGQQIAEKMYLLKDAYTSVQQATPTSPSEKTIVEKPTIYYAVNKLNRKYKREIRKGHIEEHQVKENLSGVIIKALSLLHAETEAFEAELKKAKSPAEIMLVFNKVVVE
jgi:hypothetical protein